VGMCETNKDGHLYKNIREFYGKVAGSDSSSNPIGVEVIEPKKFLKEPIQEVKHDLFNERDKDTSFYTAYAKDVFIAMMQLDRYSKDGTSMIMKEAIAQVKQARDAFSQ